MSSIETLRGILVAGTVVAAVVAFVLQSWLAAGVLVVAVAVHGAATPIVRKRARMARTAPAAPPVERF
jgi:type IV secretory pathway TrbD component